MFYTCTEEIIKSISTAVASTTTGTYYALDLGGTNFRVVRVELAAGVVVSNEAGPATHTRYAPASLGSSA